MEPEPEPELQEEYVRYMEIPGISYDDPPGIKNERSTPTERKKEPEAYCICWINDGPEYPNCVCGEDADVIEWEWEVIAGRRVDLWEDQKQVNFHTLYSMDTAIAKGTTNLVHDYHYYWEIKMQSEAYGTDVMIGLGAGTVTGTEKAFDYRSYLGDNNDSYGLSYTGAICHNAKVVGDCAGFCHGTIIGVRVDMYRGNVEFYLNREPQGISFHGLRKHQTLFPMICSTAAETSMRLIYASSWKESLLISAAKILAAAVGRSYVDILPPGLANILKRQFWMALPRGDDSSEAPLSATVKNKHWRRRND